MIDSTEHLKLEKYKQVEIDGKVFVEAKEIEYKAVDADQFITCGYIVKQSEIIPNNDGFVTDDLLKKIDITQKSTDVINVATGCGKTTAVYRLIKKIITEDTKSIVIMATPFKALVEKDMEELISDEYGIQSGLITNYSHLDKEFNKKEGIKLSFVDKIQTQYIENQRIHITTINALLRNPGDTAFEQKLFKSNYFVNLLEFCNKREFRVYLFFDEIHASIHNFKNEFIHYLTMWEKVVHKCIVSTATYTEPVNIVIKHLAYLTDDNINIFESKRVKRNDISPLDMVFFPEDYSLKKHGDLVQFIDIWVNKYIIQGAHFHIICYSKKLATCIHNVLGKKYYNTQLLTSETKKKNISFDKNKNNIGTNFSTGVDIKNAGDLLILIFPCKYSDELIKGEEGIFYDGLPTILQSVGRLRVKGRVLFTIPPLKAIIASKMSEKLKDDIPYYRNEGYKERYGLPVMRKELFLKNDEELLNKYLKKKNDFVENKIKAYKTRIEKIDGERESNQLPKIIRPEIQFPNESTFILEKGQEYLKYISYKSGKFITPYVIWAAQHDQFINCSLDKIFFLRRIYIVLSFSEDNYVENFIKYYNRYKKEDSQPDNFYDYFDFINALLKTVNKNGKNYSVIIKDNYKKITRKAFIKRIDVYIALIKSYFLIKGIKVTDPLEGLTDYLVYGSKNTYMIDDKINDQIKILSKICKEFETEFKGKKLQTKEITNSGFFDDVKIDLLRESILFIQDKDPVMSTAKRLQIKYCHKKNKDALIAFFIENFIKRGKPDRKGRREVLGRFL